jgi:Tol biopolymer transport system component
MSCSRTETTPTALAIKGNGDGPADVSPKVSPDGRHIAFTRCFPIPPCVVATVNINGRNLRQLTDKETQGFDVEHVNWSPDSKKIVFEMQASAFDVATINADGSGLTQLTSGNPGKTFSRSPCTRPTGRRSSSNSVHPREDLRHHGVDLFTMSADGSGSHPGDADGNERARSGVGCRVLMTRSTLRFRLLGLGGDRSP